MLESFLVTGLMINLNIMSVSYLLLFLSSGWFSFEDAGIHSFNILNHQAKQLVTEAKH